jgi:integrase
MEVPMREQGTTTRKAPTGIRVRHGRGCLAPVGGRCACSPSFEAWVFDKSSGTKIRKTFAADDGGLRAAKAWRAEAVSAINRGRLRAPTRRTLAEEAAEWMEKAEAGAILTKGGARSYKPAMIREVERSLRLHVLDDLGSTRLSELRRADVQHLIERLNEKGLSGSRTRGVVTALKCVLRRALEDDELPTDPTLRLRLPAIAGTRDRVVTIDEGEDLIRVLPAADRALWACALYSGLRRGELRALKWSNVDLAAGVIQVREGMDDVVGVIPPKSARGIRETPVPPALADYLTEHKASTGRSGDDLVFGSSASRPFTPSNVRRKAEAAWRRWNLAETERAESEDRKPTLLDPVTLHELRHSWVSHLAAAGFTLEEAAVFAGHSAVSMTERYRHVFPGTASAAAERFGSYVERASTRQRLAQLDAGAHTGAQEPETARLSEKA